MEVSTGTQLLRITCRCRKPATTRAIPTKATAVQAANRYPDHSRGITIAAAGCTIPVAEVVSRKGASTIAPKAQNHTANRVPALRRPIIRKSIHANRAMSTPSPRPFSNLSTDICATK